MFDKPRGLIKKLRRSEQAFLVLLLVYAVVLGSAPGSAILALLQIALLLLGFWLFLRFFRVAMRTAIWRLRNRLLVTYLFIAVVPVSLIVVLAGLCAYAVISQLAVYLAVSDLDRRARILNDLAESLLQTDVQLRPEMMREVSQIHAKRFPNLSLITRSGAGVQAWPPDDAGSLPPPDWPNASGVAIRQRHYYLWSHVRKAGQDVTVQMPLSRAYLSNMVPGLGDISFLDVSNDSGASGALAAHEPQAAPVPAPYNSFDIDVPWFSSVPVSRWDSPGQKRSILLYVHTRPSAVLRTIFNPKIEQLGDLLPFLLLAVSVLFLLVEMVALIIGSSLSRTVTRAVHNLYQGTQRVIAGDFSHRIQVHGRDQLAELSVSFNTMTENLEQLLAVAKEKERLQAEVEIARQVQEQLYPKVVPPLRTIRLQAICEPARMVSGDYYDYLCLPDGRLALAIGDVAGKGISAALLMATIQAAMRMELRACDTLLPTSLIVSDLNKQLHATTAPEKFATFFFAFYDENNGELKYTNAGHLPPLLIRNGVATRLESSGTVVGAFPLAKYTEDEIRMESGDLLVCYTDGITEPENEYGEEFGEDRLIDLISKNIDRDDGKIISLILEAVHQWTSAKEQPDDMTLLLARKT